MRRFGVFEPFRRFISIINLNIKTCTDKQEMYSWAVRIWRGIAPHEKQMLLSGSSSADGTNLMNHLLKGSSAVRAIPSIHKPALSDDEQDTLRRWSEDLRQLPSSSLTGWARREAVYGLEIPREYNGKGFSPLFHARWLRRLASWDRQGNWLHRIMVPNSLGPSQLLLRYGTPEQKDRWLPQLVSGKTIPCFGLTGPWNGSDAAAIRDIGHLETRDGVPGIRFSCEKRWITLSPEATVMGIALRIAPSNAITIVLIDVPKYQPHIRVRHHHPIGSSFPNGHIVIQDLWVPLEEAIIGGPNNLTKGWTMLMECLQQGRGISLPSVADGVNGTILWKTSFYALARRQFDRSLLEIPAIQTMLTDMTIRTFLGRSLCELYHATHHQSSSFSAIMKYVLTEYSRDVCARGMDIFAGKGLTLGPSNPIAHFYQQNPIAITVEGSNTLTRHLIIPVQSLFEHHHSLRSILRTLDREDPKAFYREAAAKIPEILGSVMTMILPHNDTIRPLSAMIGLEAYLCLLVGPSLRWKQRIAGRFTDHLVGGLLLYALEWSYHHHDTSFGRDPILRHHCRAFISRTYFHSHPVSWTTTLFNPWLESEQQGDAHIAHLMLHNRAFRSWIADDIIADNHGFDGALAEIVRLWDTHQGDLSTFRVPDSLARQVIDVDAFDDPPPPPPRP